MGGEGNAVQYTLFYDSPIIFLTVTTTAIEGQGNGAAAVVSSADPFS
jgi:hypothetical protein